MSAESSSAPKKCFYRDSKGDLHALKPGEENPDQKREREKTDEDRHYEDYLEGKSSGKIRNIGGGYGGQYGIDKAALAASASYVEDSEGSGALLPYGSTAPDGESRPAKEEERKHAPAQAYNHRHKQKGKPRQAGDGAGDTHADLINAGGTKLQQALARARADSDDDDDADDDGGAAVSAATLADRAMRVYNLPIPKAQQLDVYGNDLNVPKRERKIRKFLECFGEELQAKQRTHVRTCVRMHVRSKRPSPPRPPGPPCPSAGPRGASVTGACGALVALGWHAATGVHVIRRTWCRRALACHAVATQLLATCGLRSYSARTTRYRLLARCGRWRAGSYLVARHVHSLRAAGADGGGEGGPEGLRGPAQALCIGLPRVGPHAARHRAQAPHECMPRPLRIDICMHIAQRLNRVAQHRPVLGAVADGVVLVSAGASSS